MHEVRAQETGSWPVGHGEPQERVYVLAARNHTSEHMLS